MLSAHPKLLWKLWKCFNWIRFFYRVFLIYKSRWGLRRKLSTDIIIVGSQIKVDKIKIIRGSRWKYIMRLYCIYYHDRQVTMSHLVLPHNLNNLQKQKKREKIHCNKTCMVEIANSQLNFSQVGNEMHTI